MKTARLTRQTVAATSPTMEQQRKQSVRSCWRACGVSAMVVAVSLALPACISVNAPDKPIVIELNINIKQEVIYRLAADAENTIEENADIF